MVNENIPDFPQPNPKNRQHDEIPTVTVTFIFPGSPNSMNLFYLSYLLFIQ
jgi:hypothetical protein